MAETTEEARLERLRNLTPWLGRLLGPSANAGAAGMETPVSPEEDATNAAPARFDMPALLRKIKSANVNNALNNTTQPGTSSRFAPGGRFFGEEETPPSRSPSAQIPGGSGAPPRTAPAAPSPIERVRTAMGPRQGNGNGEATLAPTGALMTSPTQSFGEESALSGALSGPAAPSVTASGTAALPKSLQEQYRARVAELPEANGDLTPQQKEKMRLNFFLRMMASPASQRSAEAIGNAGLATSAEYETMLDKARTVAQGKRNEAAGFTKEEFGFAGKDIDNAQKAEQITALKQYYERADANDKKKIEQMAEQIAQGKIQIKAMPDGRVLKYDTKTGKMEVAHDPATGKAWSFKAPPSSAPDANSKAVAMLMKAGYTEKQAIEAVLLKPEKPEKDNTMEIAKMGAKLYSDSMGKLTEAESINMARRFAGKGASEPQKPDPVANKGRTIAGPDGRFKSDGTTWVKVP